MLEEILTYTGIFFAIAVITALVIILTLTLILSLFTPRSLKEYYFKPPYLSTPVVEFINTPIGLCQRITYISGAFIGKNPEYPELLENIKRVTPNWYIISVYFYLVTIITTFYLFLSSLTILYTLMYIVSIN